MSEASEAKKKRLFEAYQAFLDELEGFRQERQEVYKKVISRLEDRKIREILDSLK